MQAPSIGPDIMTAADLRLAVEPGEEYPSCKRGGVKDEEQQYTQFLYTLTWSRETITTVQCRARAEEEK
jgi:hypothetical protein